MAESAVESINRQELKQLRREIEEAKRRHAAAEEEKAALRSELDEVSARLKRLAARRQKLEGDIDATGRRIAALLREEKALMATLRHNRAGMVRLIAALQRLRRDPPPPFVTRPDDMLSAVRGAVLLSAAIPALDDRAHRLAARLRELRLVRTRLASARADMRRSLANLSTTRAGMQDLLARKRRLLQQVDATLVETERRMKRLAAKARTLGELLEAIRREEKRRAAARLREESGREGALSGHVEPPKNASPSAGRGRASGRRATRVAALSAAHGGKRVMIAPPGDWHPRRPLTVRRGPLPWPAQGKVLATYGARLPIGEKARGIYVATLPRAAVVSPIDARVRAAMPFRGYGQLLILDAGGGYTILLAGLAKTSVLPGQVVRAGEPLGEMGLHPAPATLTDERMERDRPILYMEVRKGRRAVNAARWWRTARQEASRK